MKESIIIKKSTFNKLIFFLSLGIFLIITILDSSFYCKFFSYNLVKLCVILSIILIIFKEILTRKIKTKELVYLCICLALSLIIAYRLNMFTMLPVFFLIYGGRNIELNKILKFIGVITSILLFFIIVSSKINLIPNYITYSGGRIREYLGFRYCLIPSMYMFNVSAISLYLHREKISLFNIIILTLSNYIIFKYTNSRLSFLLYILLLFGYLILCNLKCHNFISKFRFFRKIIVLSYALVAIFSITITSIYTPSNKVLLNINNTLEHRLYFGKAALDNYGISLFGNNIKFNGNGLGRNGLKSTGEYNYVDCLYVTMTIKFGIIFIILYIFIHVVAMNNINKNNDILLLFILFIMALHGVIDDLGFELYYNAFWFAIGTNIIPKKNISNNIAEKGVV